MQILNRRFIKGKFIQRIMIFMLAMFLTGCGASHPIDARGYFDPKGLKLEQLQLPQKGEEIALVTTSEGVFKMRFFENVAPKAVENFKTLAKEGYYNGQAFATVLPGTKIEVESSSQFPMGKSIFNEPVPLETSLDYRHFNGSVGVTKNIDDQILSQFYIITQAVLPDSFSSRMEDMGRTFFSPNVKKAYEALGGVPDYDLRYTVFAQVFYGLDVINAINGAELKAGTPINPVIIEKIEIVFFEGFK